MILALKKKKLRGIKSIALFVFLCEISFAQKMQILSFDNSDYIEIIPTYVTDDLLYFQSDRGADSIKIAEINIIRIGLENSLPPVIKVILAVGYLSLFYYMLEYMYEEAPFTIPQFTGVFSLFTLTGTGAGILYGELNDTFKRGYKEIDLSKISPKDKIEYFRTNHDTNI